MADVIADDNITRGMSLGAVNPLQVTSVVGHGPDEPDEFVVTHYRKADAKTSVDRQINDLRSRCNYDGVTRQQIDHRDGREQKPIRNRRGQSEDTDDREG